MSFFHCCLFDRECREEISYRMCVVKVGRWARTFRLPGYWRQVAHAAFAEVRKLRLQSPTVTITSSPLLRSTSATVSSLRGVTVVPGGVGVRRDAE